MYEARHLCVAFARIPDDAVGLNVGWTAGAMFGLHLALQYPKLAAKVDRLLFKAHKDHFGPNAGADLVAQAMSELYVHDEEPNEDEMLDAWTKIKSNGLTDLDRIAEVQ